MKPTGKISKGTAVENVSESFRQIGNIGAVFL